MSVPKKAFNTQRLTNTYPLWSNIRNDDQSLGYQLFNYSAGKTLDHILEQLENTKNSYYLSSSNPSDLDVYYTIKLSDTYEFTKLDDDDTELLYQTPTVSGTVSSTNYSITVASGNNIEGFWYDAIPSRIELGATYSGAHLLFSGVVSESPFIPLTNSGLAHIANQLTVTISGGSSYYDYTEGQTRIGTLQLDGYNREGLYLTEESYLTHDSTNKTLHEFASVSGMRVYGVEDPDEAFIWVKSADFNNTHYKTAYDLGWSINGQPCPYFWSLSTYSGISYKSTLDLVKYDVESIDILLAGNFVDRSPEVCIEALDQSSQPLSLLDLAVEPNSHKIWAVSPTKLYCYEDSVPYVDTSKLILKQYNAVSQIEVSSEYILRNENVTLEYVWRRPTVGVIKHRVWVEYPNGVRYSVIEGSITTYTTGEDSWDWGEPITRYLRSSDDFSFSTYGEYVFTLEVYYADGTSSIDQRIISVVYKNPIGEWSFAGTGIYRNIVGIDIDSEGKLWVLNDQGGKHEIVLHYDNMIIDWKDKTIYLRDLYDAVRVF
jgi:hypothetical protein